MILKLISSHELIILCIIFTQLIYFNAFLTTLYFFTFFTILFFIFCILSLLSDIFLHIIYILRTFILLNHELICFVNIAHFISSFFIIIAKINLNRKEISNNILFLNYICVILLFNLYIPKRRSALCKKHTYEHTMTNPAPDSNIAAKRKSPLMQEHYFLQILFLDIFFP